MKYFDYFSKSIRKEFKDVAEININKIEFRNGLSFYYEFKDLGDNVNNSTYKQEVRKVIHELHRLRKAKIDKGYFFLLLKIKERLAGVFKEVELVEFDDKDILVFIKENNERFIKEFNKGVINTELFFESMSDFVIEEVKVFSGKSDQEKAQEVLVVKEEESVVDNNVAEESEVVNDEKDNEESDVLGSSEDDCT